MKRRDARENAFLMLFERSFRSEPMDELIETAVESRALELDDYSRQLVLDVDGRLEKIDGVISGYLNKWKIDRLPRVTLSLLRLAVGELEGFPDIPARVTINEVIELAKRYATAEDASYINGVLGSYVKEHPPAKVPDAQES